MATLTVYPDAGTGGPTGDVQLGHQYAAGSGQSWATIIAAAGTTADNTTTAGLYIYIKDDTASGNWRELFRSIFTWGISGLGAGATVTAATKSLFGTSKRDDSGWAPNINIYNATPSVNYNFPASDFAQVGATAYATAISYASWSTTGYNDFALNATAITDIGTALAGAGIFKTCTRNANYDVAASSPTWAGETVSNIQGDYADLTGTTSDPKLVITYTPAPARPKVIFF